ncbi:MAG: NeuD/PglB/VioB family sugar acetyltransferase [Acetobacteraceae bacterium]|nr:NeuD/PglB/VioB family sugar acetyltransferase [Acetobacteraceae bacterium]
MARPLVVLGSGGNTLDVMDVVAAINAQEPVWDLAGVLDDATPVGPNPLGLRTLGRLADAEELCAPSGALADALFINAIGSERNHAARADIVARTGLPAERFATLVHPAAGVSPRAVLGRGCCINFGASIAACVHIGDHVWIGHGCVIGHDSMLEDHAVLAPRATLSGFVRLGAGSYVGSAAVVRQGLVIGAKALVGMGAVVLRDVSPGSVVVGNPAYELHRSCIVPSGPATAVS